LAAFATLAEADDSIDRALDQRLVERAQAGGLVLESRLAGWLAHREGLGGVRVWVRCDEEVRAVRVSRREGGTTEGALEDNRIREESERRRYKSYYGIDITDLSIYGLVLDSSGRSPDDLVAEIAEAARQQYRASGEPRER
jgi:predicted cytidylate kinase